MMDRITRPFKEGSMLRVGSTKKIQYDIDREELTYSCAANWIDYSIQHNDNLTGDMLESRRSSLMITKIFAFCSNRKKRNAPPSKGFTSTDKATFADLGLKIRVA